ncbi:MAG: hypothetical protein ACFFGZ_00790 [Candidatus Thorarchaeota archaeon]
MEIDMHLIFAIAVVIHGIGHFFPGFIHTSELLKLPGFKTESWLLAERLSLERAVTRVLAVLWLVAVFGFFITAWAFWTKLAWWKPLAGAMVVLSVVLFIIWLNAFPINIPIQAAVGNLIVIAGLIWLN